MGMTNALNLLCGLALFLYGMHVMGEGLTRASGGKLESILESLTKSKIKAVLLGAGVTAIIQSSSATTVMVVGFVNSGIMRLSQAAGVIMGANIGTTVTSWILSLTGLQGDSLLLTLCKPATFTPVLAFIGVCLLLFAKGDKKHDAGSDHDRLCRADDRHGDDERRGQAAGGRAGVYEHPADVHQPDSGRDCGRGADGDYPVVVRLGRYFAGALR